jgi:hypothetical protein
MKRELRRKLLAIRVVSQALVLSKGLLDPVDQMAPNITVTTYSDETMRVKLAFPIWDVLERLPEVLPESNEIFLAALGSVACRISIWHYGQKVLHVEYGPKDTIELSSYVAGPWERELALL